ATSRRPTDPVGHAPARPDDGAGTSRCRPRSCVRAWGPLPTRAAVRAAAGRIASRAMTSLRRPRSPLFPSRRSPLAGRALVVALGAASALALSGCTGDAEEGPTPVAVGATEYQPVLETRQPVPGSAEDEVTIGLASLTADGSTAGLRVLLTPHFAGDDPTEAYSVY